MSEVTIKLKGLTTYDRLELGEGEGISFEKAEIDRNAAGEPITLAVWVTVAAVGTLAAWLLRKHENQAFTEVVEIYEDGKLVERRTVTYSGSKSEAPEAGIIKQIMTPVGGVS